MSSLQMKTPPSGDGELLDDWEQMADSGLLDKKLQDIGTRIKEDQVRSHEIQQTHFLFNGDGSVKPSLLGHTPQIKILKRPTQNGNHSHQGHNSNDNGQAKPKLQVKTLQQKEAEYAEARLRILGEASPSSVPTPAAPTYTSDSLSLNKRMENLRMDESACGILRSPRGPDGTRGFTKGN